MACKRISSEMYEIILSNCEIAKSAEDAHYLVLDSDQEEYSVSDFVDGYVIDVDDFIAKIFSIERMKERI
jgi:hypothetical protein